MPIKKAVIMAGGNGNRMSPISEYIPKCYLPVYDKPLLVKQLEWLKEAGVEEVIITIGKRFSHVIYDFIEKIKKQIKIKVYVEIEEKIIGIANSLYNLRELIGDETFILVLGDEYFVDPIFFKQLKALNIKENIIVINRYEEKNAIMESCNIQVDKHRKHIIKLIEKPKEEEIVSNFCWSGVAVFNNLIFKSLKIGLKSSKNTSNRVFVEAINNLIYSGIPIRYFEEQGENINLTRIEDYYKAFELEYVSKKRDE